MKLPVLVGLLAITLAGCSRETGFQANRSEFVSAQVMPGVSLALDSPFADAPLKRVGTEAVEIKTVTATLRPERFSPKAKLPEAVKYAQKKLTRHTAQFKEALIYTPQQGGGGGLVITIILTIAAAIAAAVIFKIAWWKMALAVLFFAVFVGIMAAETGGL